MIKELLENHVEAVSSWPNTTWHGRNVYEEIYDLIEREIEPLLKNKGWQFQEVYLAWLDPNNCGDDDNGFIVGYDVWAPEDEENDAKFISAYIMFEVDNDPELLNAKDSRGPNGKERLRLRSSDAIEIDVCETGGFYAKNGGRAKLKSEWSGLIELRLD